MSQHASVHQEITRRTDFTALRAWVQRIPVGKVAELYYADDAPQVQRGLEQFLTAMRHDLIERAIVANPRFAEMLAKARQGGPITAGMLDVLVRAADAKPSSPAPGDHIGQWLRSRLATQLSREGIQTLAELKALIESQGPTWWRPIPRVGALRAQALIAWLAKHPSVAIDPASQVAALPAISAKAAAAAQILSSLAGRPLPLERIAALPSGLDGRSGANRSPLFCYLTAQNDLQALLN